MLISTSSCSTQKTFDSYYSKFYNGWSAADIDARPKIVKLTKTVFMSTTETSNIEWRKYIKWNQQLYGNTSMEYYSSLPDTTVWKSKPLQAYYLRHGAYNYYPVVGVSYEQVLSYCRWKTSELNTLYTKKEYEKYGLKNSYYPTKVICRLPTAEEWYTMARSKKSETNSVKVEQQRKRSIRDLRHYGNSLKENSDVPGHVYSFKSNAIGVYNIASNVSEMSQKLGLALGENWLDNKTKHISTEERKEYIKPEQWLGFRVVVELIEE